jgi:hypothetical protein
MFDMFALFTSFIPETWIMMACYAAFVAGIVMIIAGYIIEILPLLRTYALPLQLLGIVIFGGGSYLIGGYSTEAIWQARVKEMESKVAAAEAKSNEANTQVQTVYVDRVKVVHDTETKIITQIKEVEKKIDAECKVDPDAISILNRAAETPAGDKAATKEMK